METIFIVLHVVVAVAMIVIVLLQQGKGADAGSSFGAGSSNTLFGSLGAMSFLTKLTAALAVVFFVTSLTLAVLANKGVAERSVITVPAESSGDVPGAASSQERTDVIDLPEDVLKEKIEENKDPSSVKKESGSPDQG